MSLQIVTDEYSMPRSRVLSVVAAHRLLWPIVIMLLAFIALMTVGVVYDLRYVVLAFMVLFVIMPMMLAWVYIRYCLTRDAAMNVATHTLVITDESISVNWRPSLLSSEKREAEKEDREPEELPMRTDNIPLERVKRTSIGLKGITVWLDDSGAGDGFLYIPYDTIPEGEADMVVKILTGKTINDTKTQTI